MPITLTDRIQAIHPTPLGPMTSVWTEAGLYSLTWQSDQQDDTPTFTPAPENHAPSQELDNLLTDYFHTGQADFNELRLDPDGWTEFTAAVYRHCREIAPGTTLTYKELAKRSGSESASRAVGAAMSRNRILLVIPCHRVVSAGGGLRGFSAPGGLKTKQFLLDLES